MVSVTATMSEDLLDASPVSPPLMAPAAYGISSIITFLEKEKWRLKEDATPEHTAPGA